MGAFRQRGRDAPERAEGRIHEAGKEAEETARTEAGREDICLTDYGDGVANLERKAALPLRVR